jgi:hypothetical protein
VAGDSLAIEQLTARVANIFLSINAVSRWTALSADRRIMKSQRDYAVGSNSFNYLFFFHLAVYIPDHGSVTV